MNEGILNPYIAGAPVVEPSMFFGRQDVFEWIERSLSGKFVHHILVIHGQRRVGKTSVLKQIRNFLPRNYIQVFFDLQGRTNTTLDRFLWWLAREIARTLRQEYDLAVAVPDAADFAKDPDTLLARFLPNLRTQIGDQILLLTFDEFDTLEQPEIRETLARPLIEYLKRLFETEGINFIFSIGSSGHKLENMQSAYTDFFKTALYKKISFLGLEECRQLVTRPVQGVVEYEPAAVDRIFSLTAGHPYFTQLMCHELFALCQKTGKRLITRSEVEGIQEDVIERGTVNLKFVWDEANNLEKWVLALLASAGATKITELAQLLRQQKVRFSDPDFNGALLHLRDKDVIKDDNHFVVQLLQLWLQKNRPLERVREELVEVNPIANRYIEIGEEYRSLEQYGKALDSFQQALVVDPLNLKAQVSLAAVHLQQGDLPRAAQAFEQALKLDSEDVIARGGFCEAYLSMGDQALAQASFDEALRCYRRVLEVNAEHTEARQRAAGVLARQARTALDGDRDEEALSRLQEALNLTPEDAALRQQYAELEKQKLAKIIAALRAKSTTETSAGRWKEAITTLQQAVSLAPEDAGLRQSLAETKTAHRRLMLKTLREKAAAAFKTERWDETLSAWHEYLELEPEDAESARQAVRETEARKELSQFYQQAQSAMEARDFPRAVKLFKQVIYQDETYKDAARLLVQAIEAQNRRKRFWQDRHFWIGLGITLGVVAVVLASLALAPHLTSFVTQLRSTRTPTLPVGTPFPTQLPWNPDFAEQILKEINSRKPDFEDDFSTRKAEWGGDGDEISPGAEIPAGYGVMVLQTNEANVQADILAASDFVIQYDFNLEDPKEKNGVSTQFHFRETDESGIYFSINFSQSSWEVMTETGMIQNGYLSGFDPYQPHNLQIMAQGTQFAIYLDHSPLTFFINDQHPNGWNAIRANNDPGMDYKLVIDNLKFWKLPPVSTEHAWVEEFALPLIDDAKRRTPDFSDDFSTPKSEWGELPPGVKIEDGVMSLYASNGFARIPLWAEDFLLEFDVRAEKSGSNSQENYLNIAFRGPEKKRYIFFIHLGNVDGVSGGYWGVQKEEGEVTTDIQTGEASPIQFGDTLHLKLLAYGNQVGIILNDIPLAYFEDEAFQGVETSLFPDIKEGECLINIDNLNMWKLQRYSEEPLPTQEPAVSDLMNFPAPILQYISSTPPDYKDDFSTHDPIWGYGPNVDWATDTTQLVLLPKLNSKAWVHQSLPHNFVMEADFAADFGLGSNQQVFFCFRSDPIGIGANCIGYNFWVDFNSKTLGIWGMSDAVELDASPLDPGGGNRLRIIAYGNQFAVVLNDQPIGNFYNSEYTGDVLLIYAETGQEQGKVILENFAYWDLDSVTFPATAQLPEEVQQAMTGSPDIADDFSSPLSTWELENDRTKFEFKSGLLLLPPNTSIGDPSLEAQDFVLQTDLLLTEIPEDLQINLSFRSLDHGNTQGTEKVFSIIPNDKQWHLSVNTEPGGGGPILASGPVEAVEAGQWVQMMAVVYQDSFWLFLNQELLLYYQGLELPGTINGLRVFSESATSRLLLDNLKFWRLEPDWVSEFTRPVLQYTALHSPDFEDDFSSSKSDIGRKWGDVVWSEQEGVLYMVTSGEQTSAVLIGQTQAADFVYQFEFSGRDITTAQQPFLGFVTWITTEGEYGWNIYLNDGCWQTWHFKAASSENITLGTGCLENFDGMGTHRLVVVVLGQLFAYYLDDIPLFYFENESIPASKTAIRVGSTGGVVKVAIDDLKFWNLDPYTKESIILSAQIMHLITYRSPDLQEDFNDSGAEWECDNPGNQCQLGEGVAQLIIENSEVGFNGPYHSPDVSGNDFASRITLIPREVSESTSLLWMMRLGTIMPWDQYEFEYYPATGNYIFQFVGGHPDNRQVTELARGLMVPLPVDTGGTLLIIAKGRYFWAYFNDDLFFFMEDDQILEGWNQIVLRSFTSLAHIDIDRIEYWNLDSVE